MKEIKKEEKTYRKVGIYFLIATIICVIYIVFARTFIGLLWSCNISLGLFAYGFLRKNINLIKGTINYIFIPNLGFMICAIVFFTTGIPLMGINLGFDTISNGIMGIFVHLFSANVALFYTRKIKPDKKALIYSAIIFLILFILTLLFTPKSENVNFIQSTKAILGFNIPLFTIFWPLLVFLGLIMPTYVFQKYIAKKTNPKTPA